MFQYCFCFMFWVFFFFFGPEAVGSSLLDQEGNPQPLHFKAKSQPLDHRWSPYRTFCVFFEVELISGEGLGNPLQYSCLENPMDRGAWQATVLGVTKSQSGLKQIITPTLAITNWCCRGPYLSALSFCPMVQGRQRMFAMRSFWNCMFWKICSGSWLSPVSSAEKLSSKLLNGSEH